MSLSFGTSVAINNLLALRAFYTFLFNYRLHEKPTFLERMLMPCLKEWIETKALFFLKQLQADTEARTTSVSLNDVSGDFFAVLVLCQQPYLTTEVHTGQELFMLLAQMGLEFEKVKKPKSSESYESR